MFLRTPGKMGMLTDGSRGSGVQKWFWTVRVHVHGYRAEVATEYQMSTKCFRQLAGTKTESSGPLAIYLAVSEHQVLLLMKPD